MNRNKKHRRPYRKAKVKATKDFKRITTEIMRHPRTDEQIKRDAAFMNFMLKCAHDLLSPMLRRIGEKVALNAEPVEWPEELEVSENEIKSTPEEKA